MKAIEIQESNLSRFLFGNTRLALLWLVVRLYIGYQWFTAGWEKLGDSAWIGKDAGTAVKSFLMSALQKSTGQYPDVSLWYSYFIKSVVLHHPVVFSYLVVYGEIVVGIFLVLGLFTGIAAFFGIFMNFNYLFAGSISINPTMIIFQFLLLLVWRTSGWIGLDRYFLSSGIRQTESTPNKIHKTPFRNTI